MPTESSPLLLPDPRTEHPFPTAYDSKSIDSSSSSSSSRFDHGDVLRNVIIGFSDGLTVPFALTAGLSSLGSTKLVIMGGLAELFSGMISMGLGAYLAAVTERDTYSSWEEREDAHNAACLPEERRSEIHGILEKYGVSRGAAAPLVDELCANANRDAWVRFKMDFGGLRMEEPRRHRACVSGLTMGLSYLVGGLVPMVPYFLLGNVRDALLVSVAVTVVVLLAFGYVKNYVAIRDYRAGLWGAAQTLVIGVLAAGASYVIVKSLDRRDDV